jgi:hypothetical protein
MDARKYRSNKEKMQNWMRPVWRFRSDWRYPSHSVDNADVLMVNGPQTTTDTSTTTTDTTASGDSGSDVTGAYTDSASTANTTDLVNVVTTTTGLTSATTGTTTADTTSSGSGNSLTGDSTSTSTEIDGGTVTKVDTYADGSDTQTITTSATTTTSPTSDSVRPKTRCQPRASHLDHKLIETNPLHPTQFLLRYGHGQAQTIDGGRSGVPCAQPRQPANANLPQATRL